MHRTHTHKDQFIFEPVEIVTGERGRSKEDLETQTKQQNHKGKIDEQS